MVGHNREPMVVRTAPRRPVSCRLPMPYAHVTWAQVHNQCEWCRCNGQENARQVPPSGPVALWPACTLARQDRPAPTNASASYSRNHTKFTGVRGTTSFERADAISRRVELSPRPLPLANDPISAGVQREVSVLRVRVQIALGQVGRILAKPTRHGTANSQRSERGRYPARSWRANRDILPKRDGGVAHRHEWMSLSSVLLLSPHLAALKVCENPRVPIRPPAPWR